MNVGIVGAGLIGNKRAKVFLNDGDVKLLGVVDVCIDSARDLASIFPYYVPVFSDYSEFIEREGSKLDVLVVSVPNKFILPIATMAARNGINVLAEKPLGRNVVESEMILSEFKNKGLLLKTGFNHRYYPAILKAKQYVDEGKIGRVLHIRGRYGHGGRPGMEKEWRASEEMCGGGELLDQGVHLIDLTRYFVGEISCVFGRVTTEFWDIEVEDNAYFLLETQNNVLAHLHVSWTNWKNIFSFEIFGEDGYVEINGLGGSYGTEMLTLGMRRPEGGKPELYIEKFEGEDKSWEFEWYEFKRALVEGREPDGSGYDGYMANKIIDAIYKSSERRCIVKVDEGGE